MGPEKQQTSLSLRESMKSSSEELGVSSLLSSSESYRLRLLLGIVSEGSGLVRGMW